MDIKFFEDGTFAYPQHLSQTDYDRAPEDARSYYIWSKNKSRFRLRDDIWALFQPLHDEIDSLTEAKDAVLASHAKTKQALDDVAISDAITNALKAAGVKDGYLKGVMLLVRDAYAFSVDTVGGASHVVAETPYGVHSVDALVEQFLQSQDGQAYLGKEGLHSQVPSHFAAMLRR